MIEITIDVNKAHVKHEGLSVEVDLDKIDLKNVKQSKVEGTVGDFLDITGKVKDFISLAEEVQRIMKNAEDLMEDFKDIADGQNNNN